MSYNLYGVIRNHIESLMLGTVGNGGRVFTAGRFKTCPQDKTVETVPPNQCERVFRVFFTGTSELEAWNSLDAKALERVQFDIKVAYQYTKGGMFPDDSEGLEPTEGNGDIDSVNDRACSDANAIVKILSYHENFGIIQVNPEVDVFSFHPLPNGTFSLDLFKDRAVLTVKMEAFVSMNTTADYSGI